MQQPYYLNLREEIPALGRQLPRVEYKCMYCSATEIVPKWKWAEERLFCPGGCSDAKKWCERHDAAMRAKPEIDIDMNWLRSLILTGHTPRKCAAEMGLTQSIIRPAVLALRAKYPEVDDAYKESRKRTAEPASIDRQKLRELVLAGHTLKECAAILDVGVSKLGATLAQIRWKDPEVREAFLKNHKNRQSAAGIKGNKIRQKR